jgi:TATA-binding protein-associated factor
MVSLSVFSSKKDDLSADPNASEGILALTLDTVGGPAPSSGTLAPTPTSSKKLSKQEEAALAEAEKWKEVQRRGATFALQSIVREFGPHLKEKVGKLWEVTFGVLEKVSSGRKISQEEKAEGNQEKNGGKVSEEISGGENVGEILDALLVLETISLEFHPGLHDLLEAKIPELTALLSWRQRGVRHMASRCLAAWASLIPQKVRKKGKPLLEM